MLPAKESLTICFAHAAYQMKATFDSQATGIANFELRDRAALDQRIGEADVLVVSGL
jgi:D-2-hydroxyacid dehydrogenase (NADP+)